MAALDIDFLDRDEAKIEQNAKEFTNANISPKKLLLRRIRQKVEQLGKQEIALGSDRCLGNSPTANLPESLPSLVQAR